MKIFLLIFWKIQFISTEKTLLTFSMNVWLAKRFPKHRKEQILLQYLKKGTIIKKENYRPVSMLSTFSKVFEKLLFEQINDHMQSKFSKHYLLWFLDFAKTTALKMLHWLWLKNWKLFWIKNSKWVLFLRICQKLLIP